MDSLPPLGSSLVLPMCPPLVIRSMVFHRILYDMAHSTYIYLAANVTSLSLHLFYAIQGILLYPSLAL